MKHLLLFACLGLWPLGACRAGEDAARTAAHSKGEEAALRDFVGTWEFTHTHPAGVVKNATHLLFRKDGTYAALDKDGTELWGGTYELDATASPKIWDHRSHEAKAKGGDALGIYDIKDGALKACVVVGVWKEKQWQGKPRPSEFKPEAGDAYIELRRVKTPGGVK